MRADYHLVQPYNTYQLVKTKPKFDYLPENVFFE